MRAPLVVASTTLSLTAPAALQPGGAANTNVPLSCPGPGLLIITALAEYSPETLQTVVCAKPGDRSASTRAHATPTTAAAVFDRITSPGRALTDPGL